MSDFILDSEEELDDLELALNDKFVQSAMKILEALENTKIDFSKLKQVSKV